MCDDCVLMTVDQILSLLTLICSPLSPKKISEATANFVGQQTLGGQRTRVCRGFFCWKTSSLLLLETTVIRATKHPRETR